MTTAEERWLEMAARLMEEEVEDINIACGLSLLQHADDATLAKLGRMLK